MRNVAGTYRRTQLAAIPADPDALLRQRLRDYSAKHLPWVSPRLRGPAPRRIQRC